MPEAVENQEVQQAIDAATSSTTVPAAAEGQHQDGQLPADDALSLDPDEAEARAIEAERQQSGKEQQQTETPAPAPAQAQTQQPTNPAEGGLRAALAAERTRRQQAELAAANLQGRVAVLEQLATGSKPVGQSEDVSGQPTAPQAPADPIAAKEQEILQLAEQFDRGELTMAEFKAKETAAYREIRALEDSMRQQNALRSDTSLEAFNAQLLQDYPVAAKLTAQQVEILTEMAYAEAALEGKTIGQGVEGAKDLRTRIAKLATAKFGSTQPARQQTAPVVQQSSARQITANAAALDKANAAPPDVNRMGSATTGALPSDAEVLAAMEGMTDEDAHAYLNSMPGVRARIRGLR